MDSWKVKHYYMVILYGKCGLFGGWPRSLAFGDRGDHEPRPSVFFSQTSGPVLCAVIDVQNFNIILFYAINHNIGQARQNQLASSFFSDRKSVPYVNTGDH